MALEIVILVMNKQRLKQLSRITCVKKLRPSLTLYDTLFTDLLYIVIPFVIQANCGNQLFVNRVASIFMFLATLSSKNSFAHPAAFTGKCVRTLTRIL